MSTAISQGLRGKELAPALFSDFQTWIFKTPDLWPYRSEAQSAAPIFRTFETALESTLMLLMLPMELILKIFSLLSLADIVTASSTCKSMRQLVTRPNIFPHLLHDLVTRPDGSLRWLQPCSLVKGEVDRANEALRTWVDVDPTNSVNPFSAPDFPFVEFVRTCLVKSDSMRNRQRIWGIIKQVEMILEIQDDAEDSDDSDEETDDDE
ncbi:hypothetical protein DL96DRAFT_1465539 [Flagelloscypha sp. PMI_526]|nr:hypothetical protein DL96DRAFT_1465539 [Flagelloscypha sp. PMI_526]